jgi:PIN domain nuclease of toxin-antitoxin system
MKTLVTDTHPLLHYFCGSQRKLSKSVKRHFDNAVTSQTTTIYVPSTVLWEISHLVQKGNVELKPSFEEWVEALFNYRSIVSHPFDEKTAVFYHRLRFHADPFDKAIVAAALQLKLPLITNDSLIHSKNPCLIFWD